MKTRFSVHLDNERGGMAALLSVITLSMIIVSTLSSFYVYIENRAKYQERIRIGYQMGYVMEDLGRAVIEARVLGMALDSGGSCPAGTTARWLDCTRVCLPNVRQIEGIGNAVPGELTHAVCVKSGNLNKYANNSDYYCTYNVEGSYGQTRRSSCSQHEGTANPGSIDHNGEVELEKNEKVARIEKPKLRSWYGRLDNFFDTTVAKNVPAVANQISDGLNAQLQPPSFLGWLIPDKAIAQTGGSGPNDADCLTNPFCRANTGQAQINRIGNSATGCVGSNDPRCQRCTNVDRINGSCLRVALCPPWISTAECAQAEASANSRRIYQAVRVGGNVTTPPPPPPPPGSCTWECVDCSPGPATGCTITDPTIIGASCSNPGQLRTGRITQDGMGLPVVCDPWIVRCNCGGGGGGGLGVGDCADECPAYCASGGASCTSVPVPGGCRVEENGLTQYYICR